MGLIAVIVNKRPVLQLRPDQHSQWNDGARMLNENLINIEWQI